MSCGQGIESTHNQDAKDAEGRSEGVSPPIQLDGVGERRKLPHWCPGHHPSRTAVNTIFSITVTKNTFEDHNWAIPREQVHHSQKFQLTFEDFGIISHLVCLLYTSDAADE